MPLKRGIRVLTRPHKVVAVWGAKSLTAGSRDLVPKGLIIGRRLCPPPGAQRLSPFGTNFLRARADPQGGCSLGRQMNHHSVSNGLQVLVGAHGWDRTVREGGFRQEREGGGVTCLPFYVFDLMSVVMVVAALLELAVKGAVEVEVETCEDVEDAEVNEGLCSGFLKSVQY